MDIGLTPGYLNVAVGNERIIPVAQYPGYLEIARLAVRLRVSKSVIGSEFLMDVGVIRGYKIALNYGEQVVVQL